MLNNYISNEYINSHLEYLDKKQQQTTYKINYISKYVEKWLYVVANVPENCNINFIDCMCNAGIYQDGDLGSSMRVLELFNKIADEHTDKNFNILLNDYDAKRILITKDIIKAIGCKKNVHCYTSNIDVNEFLQDDKTFRQFFNCYPKRAANFFC